MERWFALGRSPASAPGPALASPPCSCLSNARVSHAVRCPRTRLHVAGAGGGHAGRTMDEPRSTWVLPSSTPAGSPRERHLTDFTFFIYKMVEEDLPGLPSCFPWLIGTEIRHGVQGLPFFFFLSNQGGEALIRGLLFRAQVERVALAGEGVEERQRSQPIWHLALPRPLKREKRKELHGHVQSRPPWWQ